MHDSFKQSLNGSTDLIFHSDEICIPHQRPEECDEADSKVRIACVASGEQADVLYKLDTMLNLQKIYTQTGQQLGTT